MDNTGKTFGVSGQPVGPIVSSGNESPYTAAFTQPISMPGAEQQTQDPIPGAYEQVPSMVQPAQPMMEQPIQPAQPMMGQPTQPAQSMSADGAMGQPMTGQMPGVAPQMPDMVQNPVTGQPMMGQTSVPVMTPPKKDMRSLIKTIAIIALSLLSLTFIGLFIWMFTQYDMVRTDVDGQITDAVKEAKNETTMMLEEEFAQREKYPYLTFAGPADYGSLTFEYPKTWSMYVANDATNGGDFKAYFNPVQVNVVSNTTLDALRVSILNKPFDDVTAEYQKALESENEEELPPMRLESVTIGQNNDIVANRYIGIIPETEFNGYVVVFKLRDKTVVLQTDSVLFENDFNTLLSTVRFDA